MPAVELMRVSSAEDSDWQPQHPTGGWQEEADSRFFGQGNEVLHLPGEQVTEEQFTDDQGNIITKKVIRKVVHQLGPGDIDDRQEQEELILEGTLQKPQDLEAEDDHFMKYSILHRDGLGAKDLTSTPNH